MHRVAPALAVSGCVLRLHAPTGGQRLRVLVRNGDASAKSIWTYDSRHVSMTVYFSHATSLCGAVWDPIVDRLEDVDTVVWDQPGHGSATPLELPSTGSSSVSTFLK